MWMRARLPFALLCVLLLLPAWSSGVSAQGDASEPEASSAAGESPRRGPSGLPLPRFVSLQSDEVNLRTGPGVRYPIDWVYRREGLPMQVIDEFEVWRRVRDRDGTIGWVHQSMLSGRRSVVVMSERSALREDPDEGASVLAFLKQGFLARLESCPAGWCRVAVVAKSGERYRGWLARGTLWGLLDGESVE